MYGILYPIKELILKRERGGVLGSAPVKIIVIIKARCINLMKRLCKRPGQACSQSNHSPTPRSTAFLIQPAIDAFIRFLFSFAAPC